MPTLTDAYLDNLLRLKILTEIQWDENSLHRPSFLDEGDIELLSTARRTIEISSFGERFVAACVAEAGG